MRFNYRLVLDARAYGSTLTTAAKVRHYATAAKGAIGGRGTASGVFFAPANANGGSGVFRSRILSKR